jgi:hypothetical protein
MGTRGDLDPVSGPAVPGALEVSRPGRVERALAVYRQEGIEAAVAPVDAGEQSFDQFDAGQALGGERL